MKPRCWSMQHEAKKYLYDIQQAEAQRLDAQIEANLRRLGFGAQQED